MPLAGQLLAKGIFMWDAEERQTDRYGRFYMDEVSFNGDGRSVVTMHFDAIRPLLGKRVRLYAVVFETRPSGHLGDMFHRITPTRPEVGEVVELGVGLLDSGTNWNGDPDLGLIPDDGRTKWWIDPHKLFRLHDQTVAIFGLETDEPFTPSAYPEQVDPSDVMISLGDGDVQVKVADPTASFHIDPTVERIPGMPGAFSVRQPSMVGNPGERFKPRR